MAVDPPGCRHALVASRRGALGRAVGVTREVVARGEQSVQTYPRCSSEAGGAADPRGLRLLLPGEGSSVAFGVARRRRGVELHEAVPALIGARTCDCESDAVGCRFSRGSAWRGDRRPARLREVGRWPARGRPPARLWGFPGWASRSALAMGRGRLWSCRRLARTRSPRAPRPCRYGPGCLSGPRPVRWFADRSLAPCRAG